MLTPTSRGMLAWACQRAGLVLALIITVPLGCTRGTVEQVTTSPIVGDTDTSTTLSAFDALPAIAAADAAKAETAADDVSHPATQDASPWRWTPGEDLRPRGGIALNKNVIVTTTATLKSGYGVKMTYPYYTHAIDAGTGRVLWRSFSEGPAFFPPLIDNENGDIVVPSNNDLEPIRGRVTRFSSVGALILMHIVSADELASDWAGGVSALRSAPAIGSDGTVYYLAGRTLHALLRDGSVAWRRRLEVPALGAWRDVSVLVAGKKVFAFDGGYLYSFATDGTLLERSSPIKPEALRSQACGIRGRQQREIIVPSTDVWAFGIDGGMAWKNRPVWGAACPIESSSGQLVFFDDGGEQELGASTASWMNVEDAGSQVISSFTTPSWHQVGLEDGEVLALHGPAGPTSEYSTARSAIIYRPGGVKPVRFELPVAYGGQLPPVIHAGLLIYASADGLVAVPLPKKPAEGHWYTTHGDFANTRRLY
jgi:outer membrane protein assembly factor BamB